MPQGASLAGAQVTVTSQAKGQSKVTTSNGNGEWRVPLLSPGLYTISITAPGFQTTTSTATVSVGVNTPVVTKLTVGQTSTTVEVSSDVVQLLHTDDCADLNYV